MDGTGSRGKSHLHSVLLTGLLLLILLGSAQAQPRVTSRWQGQVFVELAADTTPGGIIWRIDTLSLWNQFIFSKIDSALAGIGGISADSLDKLFTNGDRLLSYLLLEPGVANDMVMVTASGVAAWTATPNLPRPQSQFFYSTYIDPHNPADTSGNKHILSVAQLDKEYPVAQGTTYTGFRAHVYIRDGSNYESYTLTMVTVGSGAAAVQDGDKLIFRFFPSLGTGVDKYLRLYRIPQGSHAYGTGASNLVYGENIGYWLLPAAKFPSSGTVNLAVTLTYSVK